MKKVILNHKSYLMYDEIVEFKKEFDTLNYNNIEFILFPSVQYLSMFNNANYSVGTENFFSVKEGAFSGEINLESLKSMKINYTLIGQYQRIKIIGETSKIIKEKLFKSLSSKCNTLLCIGESKNTNRAFYSIKKEINMYLKSIEKSYLKYLSIVYEPKYLTNNVNLHKLKEIVNRIKIYMKNKYNTSVEVYYSGFIDENDVSSLFNLFDGIVLNKKSTNIEEIKKICNILEDE